MQIADMSKGQEFMNWLSVRSGDIFNWMTVKIGMIATIIATSPEYRYVFIAGLVVGVGINPLINYIVKKVIERKRKRRK